MKIKTYKNLIYLTFVILISVFCNQYYGYIGILPIDSFLIFNSGFDFLNGYLPFKDYWTIKEPFIDFLQAIFFKIFGVSWFSYVFHASVFNCIISVSTYLTLRYFSLNQEVSFFYSLCVAILTYPTAGTPFSDHHALILCIVSLYTFFIALRSNNKFLWLILPFLLGLSFLSKQAPTIYITLIITFVSLIYFIVLKKKENFIYAVIGLLFFLILLLFCLFLGNIKFQDFLIQYLLFPQSLGTSRLDWVFPLEFKRIVLRFKLHYISVSIIFYILFKDIFLRKIKIVLSEKLIFISILLSCVLFIVHQLMTINAIFIYCLIPIFSGLSHTFSSIYLKNKFINFFLIFFTLISTCYYFITYVHERTFMDLKDINIKDSINAEIIDKRLSGIKWITVFYPENPSEEVENIKFAVDNYKKDPEKKMLITDYQFISVFENQYDYSVTRFWYDFHGYPSIDNKYFSYWKKFVTKKLKENEIQTAYVFGPLHGDEKPIENLFKDCLKKEVLSETFYKINLSDCFK